MSMECDYKRCIKKATTKGHLYGHVQGSGENDSFLPVNACDEHKMTDGFFEDAEVSE